MGLLIVTTLLLWRTLPRDGKTHYLVGTPAEPYFVILFVLGFIFGSGMIAIGIFEYLA
jgi:hypothetical protein